MANNVFPDLKEVAENIIKDDKKLTLMQLLMLQEKQDFP